MSSAFYSFLNSLTNSITSRYDIKQQISTAGLWKIYDGVHKTTNNKVAIFIFDKKSLDSTFKRERGASKGDTDKVIELLKKEASNLARLRHPSVLQVVEPVTESRSSIAFATEPLTGNLSQLVKKAQSYSSHEEHSGYDLDELEIQKGLLQVAKALQFLNDAKVVHHNLNPESIYVNAKGDWKIGGLGFGVFLNQDNVEAESYFEYNEYLPDEIQIKLDYAAPEFVLNNEVTQANDMFSLGCLAFTIHNNGVSMMQTFNNLRTYEKKIQALSSMDYRNIPLHLQDVIRRLLTRHPSQRITSLEFQNSKYFDNILVSTMKFLESFPEKTREEKSQFMKGLARVLSQFPDRVLKKKILPSLVEELKDHQLLPYTLPNIFSIGQQLPQREFCELILPSLKPVFNIRDPPQNMIVLLDKLDALQEKTPREIFRDDVMPLVYAALENPAVIVQEKALRIVPSLCESLDYSTVKNSLLPRVQNLFVQTTVLSVKVSTLICFHSMIKVVDKYTMQEKLVPLLKNIKTKEPAVMLATLAVYDEMGKHLDKEIVATELLPQLWRMSFGPLLNVDQFKKFMRTIRELTTRVEESHTRHLQEVKSLEEQTRNTGKKTSTPNVMDGSGLTDQGDISFEALVNGSATATNGGSNNDSFASFNNNPASASTTGSVMNDLWSSGGSNRSSPMLSSATPSNLLQPMTPNTSSMQPKRPLSSGWASPSSATSSPTRSTFGTTPSHQQPSLKPLKPMGSPTTSVFSSTPALPPPPTTSMASISLQPQASNLSSGPNYSALHGITSQQKPIQQFPQQQLQPNRPSSSLGLLTPTSMNAHSNSQGNTIPNHQGHKATNLNSFDPLG
ncbi:kinase-like domain-containing protein [Absidia repens]|uniref:Kinase-like domain-containing protein n=1 Tax=Absidia repens TaxID=90262 RepID=A0A1X2J1C8_9FUNG|nr:kinase-like domain-containing protein [Absidia repens]